jgi:hypothetical protein
MCSQKNIQLLLEEAKYVFPMEFILTTKSLRFTRRCGVVTFQFQAMNKISFHLKLNKLPFVIGLSNALDDP